MPLVLPPSSPCSFCEYLAGEKPYTILDRNDATDLLVTYEQRGRGHLLVISVQHRETILELDRDEQAAVMSDIVRATAAIVGAFDPEGVAVWQNNGIPAHQSVPRLHFHVAGTLPDGGTEWGDVPKLTVAQTDAIALRATAQADCSPVRTAPERREGPSQRARGSPCQNVAVSVSIRRTTAHDVELVVEQRMTFQKAVRGDAFTVDPAFVEATRAFIGDETAAGRMYAWIAETTRCVGVISLLLWARAPRPLDDGQRDGYIINMYVEPAERGRGLGQRLLDECLASRDEFGIGRLFLHATEDRRPLYESAGFRPNPAWLEWTPLPERGCCLSPAVPRCGSEQRSYSARTDSL